MQNSSDIIAQRLYDAGVRHAYGIPGGEVLTMIKALDEKGIEFTLTKHENAAGFMAEGSYHASGAPAVLIATVGPGAANAINFIANALQDKVPVIYITGCVDADEAVTYTHQVFDQCALLSPITKASMTIVNGAVEEQIDKAVSIAMQDPPGPVHIDLPIGVAKQEQSVREVKPRAAISRGQAFGADLEQAQQWVANAKKPLVIAGVETIYQHAEQSVKDFVTHFNIPIITSYKGKGIVAENSPLSLGGAGLSPKNNNILLPFVAQADVVILLGYDPIEMRVDWKNPWSDSCKVIEVTAIPNTHYMHQANLSFLGDIAASIKEISANRDQNASSWSNDALDLVQQNLKQAFGVEEEWGPNRLIHTAREIFPENTVAAVDTGAHRILLSQIWECYQPRTLMQSSALCTMGCALPMALGYKKVNPNVPVVAFTGDAGFEMVMGDTSTLRDAGVPVIIIVFVDESLSLIELKQRAMNHKSVGVNFIGGTDFVKVAEGFNLNAAWVNDDASFRAKLSQALDSEKSTLLACRIGRKSYDGKF